MKLGRARLRLMTIKMGLRVLRRAGRRINVLQQTRDLAASPYSTNQASRIPSDGSERRRTIVVIVRWTCDFRP